MLILRIAIRNLLRHSTKTILIASLIATGVGLLFFSNAIFENTTRGLQTSFINSLTGNFVVGAQTEVASGIFGNEVPIVSEYESIPAITDFPAIIKVLEAETSVLSWTPIVSSAAQVNIGGYVTKCPIFGIDSRTYFPFCSDLVVEYGNSADLQNNGVFLNASLAETAELSIGRKLKIGEPIVFSMFSRGSFRAKRGTFAGVYRYPSPTEIMDHIVLADPDIVRSLCDYTIGYSISSTDDTKSVPIPEPLNLDDLFSDAVDITETNKSSISLTEIEKTLANTSERDALIKTDNTSWSFVLAQVATPKKTTGIIRSLEKTFTQNQIEARIMDWKAAAGSSIFILFAIRTAFNLGIGFLILGATLIVMNALVISVLERTNEIGSMRALGATRNFIAALFLLETMILTVLSSFFGIALSAAISYLLSQRGIQISNPLLVSLFGGKTLYPIVEIPAILIHLAGSAIIASLAWIYPMEIALKTQPVSAMAER